MIGDVDKSSANWIPAYSGLIIIMTMSNDGEMQDFRPEFKFNRAIVALSPQQKS